MEEKGLRVGDIIHAETPHGTRTFIMCYVDRVINQPFYARMFFN